MDPRHTTESTVSFRVKDSDPVLVLEFSLKMSIIEGEFL